MNKHLTEERSSLHGRYNLRSSAKTHADVNSESPSKHRHEVKCCISGGGACGNKIPHPRAWNQTLNNSAVRAETCRLRGVGAPNVNRTKKKKMLQIIQEKSIFCVLASERITTHAVAAHLLNTSSGCLIQATSGRGQEIEESQREHLHASASHSQPPIYLWEQPSIIPPPPPSDGER